eukprot:CAMPEP_0197851166 /NCGR_PEP_ID=MMETSP1438-20131217/17429_1 /TAXON_ID=1461541 /ORGANISM="Pterosperma sp., Strain CCMP1384" /LENGTH=305 /DNA_ID=CAMNT_0043464669 /DNA_START=133 /DNA_END=1047 /DNA_ORIENTATION=-
MSQVINISLPFVRSTGKVISQTTRRHCLTSVGTRYPTAFVRSVCSSLAFTDRRTARQAFSASIPPHLSRRQCEVHNAASADRTTVQNEQCSVELVPLLTDNYAYLIHESKENLTAIVDPAEAGPVLSLLEERGLKLDYIINTHHHWDHTGGNEELKAATGAAIVGPDADKERIPGIDIALKDSEVWQFGGQEVRVMDTPGHTKGHVSFYMPQPGWVFTGDTLFALGCGRLFEGTHQQMFDSLAKLKDLPGETLVFCGHEYTASNARFCLSYDGTNEALIARSKSITQLREQGLPTIPSTIQSEID